MVHWLHQHGHSRKRQQVLNGLFLRAVPCVLLGVASTVRRTDLTFYYCNLSINPALYVAVESTYFHTVGQDSDESLVQKDGFFCFLQAHRQFECLLSSASSEHIYHYDFDIACFNNDIFLNGNSTAITFPGMLHMPNQLFITITLYSDSTVPIGSARAGTWGVVTHLIVTLILKYY